MRRLRKDLRTASVRVLNLPEASLPRLHLPEADCASGFLSEFWFAGGFFCHWLNLPQADCANGFLLAFWFAGGFSATASFAGGSLCQWLLSRVGFLVEMPAPSAGRRAELAFECTTERRFGFVANCKTNLRHAAASFAQVLSCHVHAPQCQVLHRWLSDQ